MPGRLNLFCLLGVFLYLFAGAGVAHAGTIADRGYGAPLPAMEKNILLAMTREEADTLKQEAAEREAANAIAVKAFQFPKRDCRLPQFPTDIQTRMMTRSELQAVADKIKDFGRCVDKTKVVEYEAVKDLVVKRLGGTVQESGNKITFSVTPNVSKEVARLFNQVNEAYLAGFTSYEVANQKYNQSAQVWNSSQKFKAEFELKNSDQGFPDKKP